MNKIVVLFAAALCLSAQDVRGRWKATRILGYSQINSTEASPKNLIGKFVVITNQAVAFAGIRCDATLSSSIVNRSKTLVDEFRSTGKQTFSLPDEVRRVDLGCTRLLLQDKDHGILNWQGAIVQVEKKPTR